jgi:hypothetical protein
MGLRIIAYPAFRDAAGGDGFPAGAHFCRSLGAGEIVSGVDERDVAEGLREIPHLAARAGSYSSASNPTSFPRLRRLNLHQNPAETLYIRRLENGLERPCGRSRPAPRHLASLVAADAFAG